MYKTIINKYVLLKAYDKPLHAKHEKKQSAFSKLKQNVKITNLTNFTKDI